jgi:DNA modification methylase
VFVGAAAPERVNSSALDPFGGSGSTLIACEKAGRHARLIELDRCTFDVICRRFEEFSGKVAVLDSEGRTFDEIAGVRQAA